MSLPTASQANRSVQVEHHADLEVPDPPRIEKVVRTLSRLRPGRCLDIGYARGSFADYLARAGWECTGIDICPRVGVETPTLACDVMSGIPFSDASFDLLTAGEIIEHVLDEAAFLQECRRLLKPKGWLVLTTPNLSFLPNRFRMFVGKTPLFVYAPYHYHFHTQKTLSDLVRSAGLHIRKFSSSHVLYSRRRHPSGRVFEAAGDWWPSLGAHLIAYAQKPL